MKIFTVLRKRALALVGIEKPDFSMASVHRGRRDIARFVTDEANTFLVSFPRTGSHWLRMIMELYFERPSLTELYYYETKRNYLTLHTHDIPGDLFENVQRKNVIYLYRNPVDTIYSQLSFHKERLDNMERVSYWSDMYGEHLAKWLHNERFTTRKTILTYEGLKKDLPGEFSKITEHLHVPFDSERLLSVARIVEKAHIKVKVVHNSQVINLESSYAVTRDVFRRVMSDYVWDVLLRGRSYLRSYFDGRI